METYQAEIKCWNCKRTNWISGIPKGIPIEDHCQEDECRSCGVFLIKLKKEKEDKKDGKKGKK